MLARHASLSALVSLLGSALFVASCATPATGNNPTTGEGGSGNSTGGRSGSTGGNSGTGTGGNNQGTGGSNVTGTGGGTVVGTGGRSGSTGGSSGTGTGGSSGTGTGGSSGTGTGGSGAGTGGSGSGTGGSSGRPSGCPASTDVISDFEEGTTGIVTPQGGRQGWWYVFSDATNNGGMSPAASSTGGIASEMMSSSDPNYATCDHWDMHVKTTASHTTFGAGFGAPLDAVLPPPSGTTTKTKSAYDVSAYDGVSFNIKSATAGGSIFVEFPALNNQPAPDGSIKTSDGTSTGTATKPSSNGTDEYNTRGMLLTNIGTGWTKVYVPFGILGPRYLPAPANEPSGDGIKWEAPPFNPAGVLGIQFGSYTQFTGGGTFDLTVDDVTLYKGTSGLATFTSSSGTAHPFPVDSAKVGSCTKPAGATGKYLLNMYNLWKSTFVVTSGSGYRVQRPENANDTVSEGIGYGMLIAAYMGDKTLFDGLWAYEQQNKAAGNLMTWCIGGGGGGTGTPCTSGGNATGSATDADEDMAFALIEAGKQWGGTYASTASGLIGDIWTNDIDKSSMLPTGGSNFGKSTSSQPTNPSYFAPAYYRVFGTIDTTDDWNKDSSSVVSKVYAAIGTLEGAVKAMSGGKAGLLPAWCSGNCTTVGGGSYTENTDYQYDAHRIPWRLGLDYCWNSTGYPSAGSTFLSDSANYFNSIETASAGGGVGNIVDKYSMSGGVLGDANPNSMSAVGCAGVGAMAAGNSFMTNAYQFVLDGAYTADPKARSTAYTYFNATVGLLTALTMSGNFNSF